YRESVTLSDAEPSRKIAAQMKGGSVTVLVAVDPPPTIWLDGKPWTGDRKKLEGLSAGEEHKIVLSAPGYAVKTIAFVAQPNETKTIQDHLAKADAASAAAPAPADGAPQAAK